MHSTLWDVFSVESWLIVNKDMTDRQTQHLYYHCYLGYNSGRVVIHKSYKPLKLYECVMLPCILLEISSTFQILVLKRPLTLEMKFILKTGIWDLTCFVLISSAIQLLKLAQWTDYSVWLSESDVVRRWTDSCWRAYCVC